MITNEITKQRRVVCAACRCSETKHIIIGPRHFDPVMKSQFFDNCMNLKLNTPNKIGDTYTEQGFIDQYGVFMNRQEAWKVAEAAGQIIYRCGGDTANGGTLYSENLY